MPSDAQTTRAFGEGQAFHNGPLILDEATNIGIGTEYMQYWIDISSSIEAAYKKYRGLPNGVYYAKINACAKQLRGSPDSMDALYGMVKVK